MASVSGPDLNSPVSIGNDDSDESFVVLNRSIGPETLEHIENSTIGSLSSSNIQFPSIPQTSINIPVSVAVSQPSTLMSVSTSCLSDLNSVEVQSKLESLLQENVQLKETLHQNNLAMRKQFNTLVMWQEDVMKVHQSHKEKFEETKKLIMNLRAENQELKKSSSLPFTNTQHQDEPILDLKSKISTLKFELDTLRQANIKHENEHLKIVQNLEIKLAEAEKAKAEQIASLSKERDELKTKLADAQQQVIDTKQKFDDLKKKVPSDTEIQDLQILREEVRVLTNENLLKNSVLKEKSESIDKLHEEINKLKIDNESILILKAQVELYQNDFNLERDARNVLKQEKDRLADDLGHLQRRNQELLREVDRLEQVNCVPQYSAREGVPKFRCPKCNFSFYDYQALENHVHRCIDLDMLP